jgi:hypothetical protein
LRKNQQPGRDTSSLLFLFPVLERKQAPLHEIYFLKIPRRII